MRKKESLWLVTGGAGFIGSNIVAELVRRKKRVRVLDNLCTGKPEHMASFRGQIEFVRGDIREPRDCRRAAQGADVVIHQAALRSVPKSVDNPGGSHDSNATGTLNMLIAAREAKADRKSTRLNSSHSAKSRMPSSA